MKIAVDAMGGDHAPEHPVAGAVLAARQFDAEVVLVGQQERIQEAVEKHRGAPPMQIVHADEVVGMDEPPAIALRRKRGSSIHVAAELLRDGEVQGLVSAGNTGAIMVTAKLYVGTLTGVDRPALAVVLPSRRGRVILLDVGANIDPKSHHLMQFAVMGHCFAEKILGIDHPRVGLLSIGEEAGKGTDLIREAHKALAHSPLNFLGNMEGRDIYSGSADIVVCDGFTGNVVLKTSESVVETMLYLLREELSSTAFSKLAARLARGSFRSYRRRVDYAEFGGAPLLGIRGLCVICHGRSSAKAIMNGIRVALEYARNQVSARIEEALCAVASHGNAGSQALPVRPKPLG
ncbi:MAG: phosphate acyltransferase PlsX [Acidobacteriota bacterium]